MKCEKILIVRFRTTSDRKIIIHNVHSNYFSIQALPKTFLTSRPAKTFKKCCLLFCTQEQYCLHKFRGPGYLEDPRAPGEVSDVWLFPACLSRSPLIVQKLYCIGSCWQMYWTGRKTIAAKWPLYAAFCTTKFSECFHCRGLAHFIC